MAAKKQVSTTHKAITLKEGQMLVAPTMAEVTEEILTTAKKLQEFGIPEPKEAIELAICIRQVL